MSLYINSQVFCYNIWGLSSKSYRLDLNKFQETNKKLLFAKKYQTKTFTLINFEKLILKLTLLDGT